MAVVPVLSIEHRSHQRIFDVQLDLAFDIQNIGDGVHHRLEVGILNNCAIRIARWDEELHTIFKRFVREKLSLSHLTFGAWRVSMVLVSEACHLAHCRVVTYHT